MASKTDDFDAIELFKEEIAEAQTPAIVSSPPLSSMPEEFSRATLLALKAAQEILALPLDDKDDNLRAKIGAKASLAAQQISAQLKADDQRLKAVRSAEEGDFYAELRKALEDHRAHRALQLEKKND